jgi:methionyl-tRNA formyltransferase
MKLVFCGTPQFAVPTLLALIDAGHEIALVLTQPDRPSGRGMQLFAPPVKQMAEAAGLEILQPEKIKNNENLRAQLTAIAPDAIVVVAYGRIIPKWMLDLPRSGNINLHGSLLPKYRGAAPIQWAIARGETITGITTMRLDEGLDTGDILLKREVPIGPAETAEDLYLKLSQTGAEVMIQTLAGLADGSIKPQEQDNSAATLAPILTREDGAMNFSLTANEVYNRWRGFQPWPGAWTTMDGKKLLVSRMQPALVGIPAEPGTVHVDQGHFFASCAEGSWILLEEVQLEGKKRMPSEDFLRGHQLKSGDRLGQELEPGLKA